MKPFFKNILDRIAGHWKSSLVGAIEGAGISGLGQIVSDPTAAKVAFGIAAWRFVVGLLSRDPA